MNILFSASEVTPFAKTGGLADVAGSLPLALGKQGHRVLIVMPRYRGLPAEKKKITDRVEVHFVEHEEFYNRATLYGNERGDYPDNHLRFAYLCRQTLAIAKKEGFKPDIVHANDWQTALLPVLLKTELAGDDFFRKAKTILTIHNLAYQGAFSYKAFEELGLDLSLFNVDAFEFYGRANFLKAGLIFSDALSTVSRAYAEEIQTNEYGFGLDEVVKKRKNALRGILNGIDIDAWNPATDKNIPAKFSAADPKAKSACKTALQKKCGLEVADVPVFGLVSRLAEQKGLDLLSGIADDFLNQPVQFVLLGEGDPVYHTTFQNIGKRHPKNASIHLGFDAMEAHEIYAGSDFFLMPSYFEPCGLGQMISMRYGTLPIVRKTGGLADTVTDVTTDEQRGNGFVFEGRNPDKLLETIKRAVKFYEDKIGMVQVRKRAMSTDFSWDSSAKEYEQYYADILKS